MAVTVSTEPTDSHYFAVCQARDLNDQFGEGMFRVQRRHARGVVLREWEYLPLTKPEPAS